MGGLILTEDKVGDGTIEHRLRLNCKERSIPSLPRKIKPMQPTQELCVGHRP